MTDHLNSMLMDAADELRGEGMEALAAAVDIAREERAGVVPPPSSARLLAIESADVSLAGARR